MNPPAITRTVVESLRQLAICVFVKYHPNWFEVQTGSSFKLFFCGVSEDRFLFNELICEALREIRNLLWTKMCCGSLRHIYAYYKLTTKSKTQVAYLGPSPYITMVGWFYRLKKHLSQLWICKRHPWRPMKWHDSFSRKATELVVFFVQRSKVTLTDNMFETWWMSMLCPKKNELWLSWCRMFVTYCSCVLLHLYALGESRNFAVLNIVGGLWIPFRLLSRERCEAIFHLRKRNIFKSASWDGIFWFPGGYSFP